MPLPSPQKFAELLANSILPEEVKKIILEKLPTLTSAQINAIFDLLQQGQEKVQKAQTEFEAKLSLAQIKFEQELATL